MWFFPPCLHSHIFLFNGSLCTEKSDAWFKCSLNKICNIIIFYMCYKFASFGGNCVIAFHFLCGKVHLFLRGYSYFQKDFSCYFQATMDVTKCKKYKTVFESVSNGKAIAEYVQGHVTGCIVFQWPFRHFCSYFWSSRVIKSIPCFFQHVGHLLTFSSKISGAKPQSWGTGVQHTSPPQMHLVNLELKFLNQVCLSREITKLFLINDELTTLI